MRPIGYGNRNQTGPTPLRGLGRSGRDKSVNKQADEPLARIVEKTQAALRDSIDQAKRLASEAERLVKRHRNEITKR